MQGFSKVYVKMLGTRCVEQRKHSTDSNRLKCFLRYKCQTVQMTSGSQVASFLITIGLWALTAPSTVPACRLAMHSHKAVHTRYL